jgi:hypothetical protein
MHEYTALRLRSLLLLPFLFLLLLHAPNAQAQGEEALSSWKRFQYVEADKPLFPAKPLPSLITDLYDALLEEAEAKSSAGGGYQQRQQQGSSRHHHQSPAGPF